MFSIKTPRVPFKTGTWNKQPIRINGKCHFPALTVINGVPAAELSRLQHIFREAPRQHFQTEARRNPTMPLSALNGGTEKSCFFLFLSQRSVSLARISGGGGGRGRPFRSRAHLGPFGRGAVWIIDRSAPPRRTVIIAREG